MADCRRTDRIFHHRHWHTQPGRAYVEIRKHGRSRTTPAQTLFRARLERIFGCLNAVAVCPGEPHLGSHILLPLEMNNVTEKTMNGAESLVRSLLAGGVEVCFANPGTSQLHFVAALD